MDDDGLQATCTLGAMQVCSRAAAGPGIKYTVHCTLAVVYQAAAHRHVESTLLQMLLCVLQFILAPKGP